MKVSRRPGRGRAVQITKEWFDAPHPNPLHPVGLRMDPRTRTVEVPTKKGSVVAGIGYWIQMDQGR